MAQVTFIRCGERQEMGVEGEQGRHDVKGLEEGVELVNAACLNP